MEILAWLDQNIYDLKIAENHLGNSQIVTSKGKSRSFDSCQIFMQNNLVIKISMLYRLLIKIIPNG